MLAKLLGSRLRARLLGWLLLHPDDRYFVRQLESIIGEDATNISRELAKLATMGIVTSHSEGRQKYYQADVDCPVYTELRGLVLKTVGLVDTVRTALEPLADRLKIVFLFGSFARGQEKTDSDVDLMAIGEVTFGEVIASLESAQTNLGREINATVYPVTEFRDKLRAGNHFLNSLMGQEKIFIIGGERELEGLG